MKAMAYDMNAASSAVVRLPVAEPAAVIEDHLDEIALRPVGRRNGGFGDIVEPGERGDVGVRHRPLRRQAEELARLHVARPVEAADVGVARRGDASVRPLRPAQAELDKPLVGACREPEAGGVRRNAGWGSSSGSGTSSPASGRRIGALRP